MPTNQKNNNKSKGNIILFCIAYVVFVYAIIFLKIALIE